MHKKPSLKSLALILLFMLLLFSCHQKNTKTLTIFHTNDTHGRGILDTSLTYAKISSYVKNYKKKHKATLFLDAGDATQGIAFTDISKGSNMIHIMNEMPYDAMTLGNHEFNFGAPQVDALTHYTRFPVLNINFLKDGENVTPSYVTYKLNGITTTIVGALSPNINEWVAEGHRIGYQMPNPLPMLNSIIAQLRENCDVLIALVHMGATEDYTSVQLAKDFPQFDLIVDGHDHVALPDGMMVGNTLIVNTGEYANHLGRVDLSIANKKIIAKNATLLTQKNLLFTPEDKKINALIASLTKKYESALEAVQGPVIAELPKTLHGERDDVYRGETNLSRLIADSTLGQGGADIAIVASDDIRMSINRGPITQEDIHNAIPFNYNIVVIEMTGEEIKKALENGVSHYPETAGAFPQVAGMKATIDSKKPVGQRVRNVSIRGRKLNPKKTYTVATTTYLQTEGADGYAIMQKPSIQILGQQKELFTKYLLERLKTKTGLQTKTRLTIK